MLLTACQQRDGDDYVYAFQQKRVDLPGDVKFVLAMEKTYSGKLWMLGVSSGSAHTLLWELNDDDSWSEVSNISELLALGESDVLVASPITKSEKVLCIFFDQLHLEGGLKFYLVDSAPESSFRELNIDTSLFTNEHDTESRLGSIDQVFPLNNDRFLIQDGSSNLFVLDSTAESIESVPFMDGDERPYLFSAAEHNDSVIVLCERLNGSEHSMMFYWLDISTGVFSSIDNNMEFEALLREHEEYSHFKVSPNMEGGISRTDELTICISNGIYKFSDNELAKVADADGTVLSDPTKTVLGCVFDNKDDFYLICWNSDGSETPFSLYKYERVFNSFEPSRGLRVYTLLDNAEVRQAIALYKEVHPDVKVELEIGIVADSVTAEDALRNLNIELLVGKGPDVLFLDGLPIEDFLEQGVLFDLTDIYDEAISSGLYYENIISAFVVNGECKVIPLRFAFPLVIAKTSVLDRLDSLPALVDLIEEAASNNPESALFCEVSVLDNLLAAYYPSFFDQASFNAKALTQFFEGVKSLSIILEAGNQRGIHPEPGGNAHLDTHTAVNDSTVGNLSFCADPNQILIYQIFIEQEFGISEAVMQNVEIDAAADVLSLGNRKCFIPKSYVAINSSCNEIELAQSFVRMTLGNDYHQNNQMTGLSIMRSIIADKTRSAFIMGLEDGGHLFAEPFSNETLASYYTLFSSLDTPVVIDSVIQETIYEQLRRYLDDEASLEEAVSVSEKMINLYLSQ